MMSPTYRVFQFLTGPTVAKIIHGLAGLAGTAGLAYGAKKLFDKAVDDKVKKIQDGGRLGPAGYQLVPQYLAYQQAYKKADPIPLPQTPASTFPRSIEPPPLPQTPATIFPRSKDTIANDPSTILSPEMITRAKEIEKGGLRQKTFRRGGLF